MSRCLQGISGPGVRVACGDTVMVCTAVTVGGRQLWFSLTVRSFSRRLTWARNPPASSQAVGGHSLLKALLACHAEASLRLVWSPGRSPGWTGQTPIRSSSVAYMRYFSPRAARTNQHTCYNDAPLSSHRSGVRSLPGPRPR